MRNFMFGGCFALMIVFGVQYCSQDRTAKDQVAQNTTLIRDQIKNVGKLVVTEGNFSQVFTYNDSERYFIDALTFTKEALVVVDAKAMVGYDLSKLNITIDSIAKKVIIDSIPQAELTVVPDIKYFDLEDGIFNSFKAEDFNLIKDKVVDSVKTKIYNSTLMSNAQNRLISELQKLYVLTNSMDWTLEFRNHPITSNTNWRELEFLD